MAGFNLSSQPDFNTFRPLQYPGISIVVLGFEDHARKTENIEIEIVQTWFCPENSVQRT